MRLGRSPRFGSSPYEGAPRGRPSLKEAFAVLLSGALAGLSQPLVIDESGLPLDESGLTGVLMLIALVPALVVARAGSTRRAYLLGAFALWGYFLVVAHWLVVPFSTYGGAPLWLAAPAVLLMTGAVAAFVAIPFAITRAAERRLGWPAWLTFPAALAGVELIRNSVPFGGMPWGTLGSSLATVDVLRQGASLFGVYGLGFVVGLTNGVVSDLLVARRSRRKAPVLGLALSVVSVVGLLAYGAVRLNDEPGEGAVTVGLLQPSIPQDVINRRGSDDVIVGHYQQLQQEALAAGADVVVWPEAALRPRAPADSATLEGAGVVGPGQREPPAAIVGSLSVLWSLDDESGRLVDLPRTSAFLTGKDLAVTGRYDKVRLVPFGEYMPWPFSLFTDRVLTGPKSLVSGDAPRALPLEPLDAKVGVTICWDGLFPDVTRALVEDGAVQLYNLTNDAWYGRSSQPWQHLAAYALRATETGRPVVRAANSGISGWFDARGRFYDGTLPFERAAVVAKVPTSTETTVYVRFGEWVALPSLVFTGLLVLLLGFARVRGRGI